MPGERRPVSRAESQQRTREEVLDAAEQLFLARGLRETTVAKVASAAGRTQGAIYANFASKENLCAEVLFRRGMKTISELSAKMAETGGRLDDEAETIADVWKLVVEDQNLVTLLAEYALAIHKDPEQIEVSKGHVEVGFGMLRTVLNGAIPVEIPREQRDLAVTAVMATAAGLALQSEFGVFEEGQAADLLVRTLRLWVANLRRTAEIGETV